MHCESRTFHKNLDYVMDAFQLPFIIPDPGLADDLRCRRRSHDADEGDRIGHFFSSLLATTSATSDLAY